MRERRRIVFVTLLVAGSVLIVGHTFLHGRQSFHAEEDLNHWLYSTPILGADARSNLDTNAIPFLISALGKHDGTIDRSYRYLFSKLPLRITRHLPRPRYASAYRANALKLLESLGREFPSELPVIIPALEQALRASTDPGIRGEAAEALASLASRDPEVASELSRALTDGDPRVRAYVAYELRLFEQHPTIAVPALTERLRDKDARVRATAAASLRAFTASARMAVPLLLQALNDEAPAVRQAARQTLNDIQGKPPTTVNADRHKEQDEE